MSGGAPHPVAPERAPAKPVRTPEQESEARDTDAPGRIRTSDPRIGRSVDDAARECSQACCVFLGARRRSGLPRFGTRFGTKSLAAGVGHLPSRPRAGVGPPARGTTGSPSGPCRAPDRPEVECRPRNEICLDTGAEIETPHVAVVECGVESREGQRRPVGRERRELGAATVRVRRELTGEAPEEIADIEVRLQLVTAACVGD